MSSHASPPCRVSHHQQRQHSQRVCTWWWWWWWWCARVGAVEVGVAQVVSKSYRRVVEDALAARDAGVTTANGRWRGKGKNGSIRTSAKQEGRKEGREDGVARIHGGDGDEGMSEAEVGDAVDGVGEKRENGRTGREGKDDLGRGEGRSSNAVQAAFDADEEEGWRGEKGGVDRYIHGERRGSAAGRIVRGRKPGADDACDGVGGGRGRERREAGKGRQWMEGKGTRRHTSRS
ncbi:hypothetical protein C8J57DRAFT_1469850 [Mycena rebaudengoi]|nr:hypothetical protein C8J57DRAFT_1469850 [Mycena rebaudengoi]